MPETLSKYGRFIKEIDSLDLLDAPNMQPIINGTELQKALETRAGPWMKPALDIIMSWQLRNPGIADPAEAIEAVRVASLIAPAGKKSNAKTTKSSHGQKGNQKNGDANLSHEQTNDDRTKGELISALLHKALHDVLKPIFIQARNPEVTATGRGKMGQQPKRHFASEPILDDKLARPWKHTQSWALDLLLWSTRALSTASLIDYEPRTVEQEWGDLVPPILTVMDDTDVRTRAIGCQMLRNLLSATPTTLISRTGLAPLFKESLMASLTYLPTLTPEPDSVILLDSAYSALLQLTNTCYPPPGRGNAPSLERIKMLDEIIRKGVLLTFAHAGEYVHISEVLLRHLSSLVAAEGIDSVKHLKDTIPLISNVLRDPLGPAYPPLLIAACKTLQSALLNAWPRASFRRGQILQGLVLCWMNTVAESGKPEIEEVKRVLVETVDVLEAAEHQAGTADEFRDDVEKLVQAEVSLAALLRPVLKP